MVYGKQTLMNDSSKPTKQEMLEMLDQMIKRIEDLPQQALYTPITHADFVSLLILLHSILSAE